jgi:hypothetical protein
MRRLFALMLIATSGWLLYRTSNDYVGGVEQLLSRDLAFYLDEPRFLFPFVGSAMGLLGGLTAFFGGPGGAMLALGGGVSVAGFALSFDETMDLAHIWDDQLAVGVLMLMLAAMAASITRRAPIEMGDNDDDKNSRASGRRVF